MSGRACPSISAGRRVSQSAPGPADLCCGSAQRPPGTRSMMGELPHSLPGHNFLNPRLLLLPEK